MNTGLARGLPLFVLGLLLMAASIAWLVVQVVR